MKVVITGSRKWKDPYVISNTLDELPGGELIVGGARGADTFAQNYGEKSPKWSVSVFQAEWERYGKRAGFIRNHRMLDENPDLVLAFWDGKSPGTKHTIHEAEKRGLRVRVVRQ